MAMGAEKKGGADAPEGEQRQLGLMRKLFRWTGRGALLVAVLYSLSNLWLWSSWGSGVVEAELEKRTSLDWEIESLSWSPWNGITVYGAEMLQPEELREADADPVLRVERLRVEPYWLQLARGRIRPKHMQIDRPAGNVSVEMLAALVSNMSQTEAVAESQKKMAKAPVGQPKPKDVAADPETETGTREGKEKDDRRQQAGQQAARPTAPVREKRTANPVSRFPVRLTVRGASLRLKSVRLDRELLSVNGCEIDMVLLGEESSAPLTISSISVLGMDPITDFEQRIVWEAPYLEVSEQSVSVGGVDARMIAQLGLGRNPIGRFPFQFSLIVDKQEIKELAWSERLALQLCADRAEAAFSVKGYLHRPRSWSADGLLLAKNMRVTERHGGHTVVFDEVQVPYIFRGGVLMWDDVRLMSETLAVMGNGRVSLRDGHLSVTRLVTSRHGADILRRGLTGAGITSSWDPWWERMDTPERVMRDLLVTGPLLDPVVDAARYHRDISLKKIIEIVVGFVRQEMREEGATLEALPGEKQETS